jgi:hypothetical protein
MQFYVIPLLVGLSSVAEPMKFVGQLLECVAAACLVRCLLMG